MKKTKFMTRLSAVVFALALLFAMAIPAFAAGETGDTYSGSSQTTVDSTNNTIPIKKAIVVFNPETDLSVRLPATTYTYRVAPFTFASGTTATVTDAQGDVATVNSGVEGGVTGTTISFDPTTDSVAAKSTGTEFENGSTLSVVFDNGGTPTFTHAGIYRYVVTESNDTLAADGILRDSTYSPVRYLDVYIANDGANLVLEGAVFFTTHISSTDGTPGTDSITNTTTGKTTGFEPGVLPGSDGSAADYASDTTVDKYYTYNLTVSKTTTGNMADKNHQFPITVNMAKASGVDDVTVDVSVSNSQATLTSAATTTLDASEAFEAKLANGGEMYIKGIPYYTGATPAYATVTSISEQNDSPDKYTVSVAATNMTSTLAFGGTATNAGATETTTSGTTATFNATPYTGTIAITNTMSTISPTGLAFRVAPYVLMLLAGVSLVLLFTRRRREVTDMI